MVHPDFWIISKKSIFSTSVLGTGIIISVNIPGLFDPVVSWNEFARLEVKGTVFHKPPPLPQNSYKFRHP